MARNLSPNTLETYLSAVTMFADFSAERGMPLQVASVRREHVEAFLAWMTEAYKPASVKNRYTGLRQFFAGLLEEREISETPMRRIPPPTIPKSPPPLLSEAQVLRRVGGAGASAWRASASEPLGPAVSDGVLAEVVCSRHPSKMNESRS